MFVSYYKFYIFFWIFLFTFSTYQGTGKFDLIKEIAFIKCPRCRLNKIESKNIGFINCEWSYRGYLTNKKNCTISGDGLTIDNKLYILNEVSLNQYIEKMELIVKDKVFIATPTAYNKNKKLQRKESDADFDYDSIGLESIRSNEYKDSQILFNNNNNSLVNSNNNEILNSAASCINKSKQSLINKNNSNNNTQKNSVTKQPSLGNINSNYNSFNNTNFESPNNKSIALNKRADSANKGVLQSQNNLNLVKSRTQDLEIITEKHIKCGLNHCMSLFSPAKKPCLDSINNKESSNRGVNNIKNKNYNDKENNNKSKICNIF